MKLVSSLKVWFAALLETTTVAHDVRPYVLTALTRSDFNGVEKSSVVLELDRAKQVPEFQSIGDYAVWMSSFKQGYQHQAVVESCGRYAYERCYLLTNRRVHVYGMLADCLPTIAQEIHIRLGNDLTSGVIIDA